MAEGGEAPELGAKPAATLAAAESHPASAGGPAAVWNDRGLEFTFGRRLRLARATCPHTRRVGDPLFRTLSIYTSDPAASRREGATALVKLAWEPLQPGPVGSVLEIINRDGSGITWPRADLDSNKVMLEHGYPPSLSSPEFQAQMVYTVGMLTYQSFQLALGRPVAWPFPRDGDGPARLRVRPYGAKARNAWYDRRKGELVFGYFEPEVATAVAPKGRGSRVYTSLSHDVIVHEMSHALLDGLRARFLEPTHVDVLALHEAFADLMAFFQQFQFDEPVRAALTKTDGELLTALDLVTIANEFGTAVGLEGGTLRALVDQANGGATLHLDDAGDQPHLRGAVLVRAIVEAFAKIYARRTKRFVRLATNGRNTLLDGDLSEQLLDLLVREVKKLAAQFQSICIRAIDYCPPVDVRFGDYLRAMITADMELVPDDDLGYRETLIREFGARGIYGEETLHMTEDALRWRPPSEPLTIPSAVTHAIARLATGIGPEGMDAVRRDLAAAIGTMATEPANGHAFGIVSPRSEAFDPDTMALPEIESIAIARRVGLDQQLTFDLVAEITQRRMVASEAGSFAFYGGSTVIMDSTGCIRFAVRKRVDKHERSREQTAYMTGAGAGFWERHGSELRLIENIPRKLCAF